MSPDDPRHGTTRGHAAGCREQCCRTPRNLDEARRRKYRQVLGIQRRIPALGTQRRIRALMRLGWTGQIIADHCGWKSAEAVTEILKDRKWVFASTAAKVDAAYRSLSMRVGPSEKNRRASAAKGWAPPLAWDDIDDPDEQPTDWQYTPRNVSNQYADDFDPVVVQRLLEGDRIPATPAERAEALATWVANGGTERELCLHHGWKTGRYKALTLVRGGAA